MAAAYAKALLCKIRPMKHQRQEALGTEKASEEQKG